MIQFIIAVRDKYDKLCTDYNNLKTNQDKLLALKNQKEAVIQHLQDQNAGIFVEIDILQEKLERQGIIDPSVDNAFNEH